MLVAFARLTHLPHPDGPTVIMASTVNEEFGASGAKALAGLWSSGESELFDRPPDSVVVAHKASGR